MKAILSIILILSLAPLAYGGQGMGPGPGVKAYSGGGITPPTFIQEAETVWNTSTTPKTTGSFTVQTGDVLVAFCITEYSATYTVSSSPSLTWSETTAGGAGGYLRAYIWTATATSNTSMTVTCTRSGGDANLFGLNVLTFRGSAGVGATASTTGSGAPSLNITTNYNNSAIVVASGDWNAVDGASRTWRTGAGALTEQTYFRDGSYYTVYGGYHADAGTAGAKTVGLTAPAGQAFTTLAVEVRGQ